MQEAWMQKVWGLRKQTSCKTMWIKHPETQVIFLISIKWIRLARALFSVESMNDIKIKKAHRRIIGGGWTWEGISLMNTCWVNHSVFDQFLNVTKDGEIPFHLKRILKVLCHYTWKTWYILCSSSGLKDFCIRFYHARNVF